MHGLVVALDALLAQRAHEIAYADVHVGVVLDVDPPIDRPHRLALDDFRRAIAEIHVSLQASEVQHEIRLVHPRDDRRRAYRPDVDAHVQRMIHRERALAEHRGQHRRAHLLCQLDQFARGLVAMDLDARDQHRFAALIEYRGGFACRLFEPARVGFVKPQMAIPFQQLVGHFDLAIDHVAMDFDIAGALLGPDRAHHIMQLHRGAARIGQHRRGAGDFLVDAMLGFDFARLMVNQRAQLALLFAGAARQDEQRHALGKRARHRIDHVVAARAVGHADDADFAGRARVAVGRETDARLVRKGQDLRPLAPAQGEKQLEREVARNAENVGYADLAQVGDQEIAHRHVPFQPRALLSHHLAIIVADWRTRLARRAPANPLGPWAGSPGGV